MKKKEYIRVNREEKLNDYLITHTVESLDGLVYF